MIKITKQGTVVALEGLDAKYLDETLSYIHRSTERKPYKTLPNGREITRSEAVFEKRNLYFLTESGVIIFNQGLLPRVRERLAELKAEYEFECNDEPLVPNYDNLRKYIPTLSLRGGQDEVISTMTVVGCGQIVAPAGFGKTFCLTVLCALYPDSRIMIVTPSATLTRQTVERLEDIFGSDDVGQLGAGKHEISRITVVCSKSLHRYPPDKADIIIVDESHKAAARTTSEPLMQFVSAKKIIGLTATPKGRSDGAELAIESLLGPVVLTMKYQDAQEAGVVAPMLVHVFDIKQGPTINDKSESFVKKRRGYWNNVYRNKYISKVVQHCLKSDNPLGIEDPKILILVDTATHVEQLSRMLPDFSLVYKSTGRTKLPKLTASELDSTFDKFRSGEIRSVIATSCWGTGVDFPDLDIIVIASGTSSPIEAVQYTGRCTRVVSGKDKVGHVLDFKDSWSAWALRRSKSRLKEYKKMGWEIEELQ